MNSLRIWWYGMLSVRLRQLAAYFDNRAGVAERCLIKAWREQDSANERQS